MKRNQKTARVLVRIAGAALILVATIWGIMFVNWHRLLGPHPKSLTHFSFMWLSAVLLFALAGVGLVSLKSWCRLPAMCIFGTIGGYITSVMFGFLAIGWVCLMLPFVMGILILFGTDWIKSAFKPQIEDEADSQRDRDAHH